jgi:hypothetical protein
VIIWLRCAVEQYWSTKNVWNSVWGSVLAKLPACAGTPLLSWYVSWGQERHESGVGSPSRGSHDDRRHVLKLTVHVGHEGRRVLRRKKHESVRDRGADGPRHPCGSKLSGALSRR